MRAESLLRSTASLRLCPLLAKEVLPLAPMVSVRGRDGRVEAFSAESVLGEFVAVDLMERLPSALSRSLRNGDDGDSCVTSSTWDAALKSRRASLMTPFFGCVAKSRSITPISRALSSEFPLCSPAPTKLPIRFALSSIRLIDSVDCVFVDRGLPAFSTKPSRLRRLSLQASPCLAGETACLRLILASMLLPAPNPMLAVALDARGD